MGTGGGGGGCIDFIVDLKESKKYLGRHNHMKKKMEDKHSYTINPSYLFMIVYNS